MRELYLAECRRLLKPTLVVALLHLLFWMLISRTDNFFQTGYPLYMMMLGASMVAAVVLAVFQFLGYRDTSRWIWLLHRPLPRSASGGALAGAAASMIVLAVCLPTLLTVWGNEHLLARAADQRHYIDVLLLTLFAMMAWLVGAYVMIRRKYGAIVMLLFPLILLPRHASAYALLAPAVAILALLGYAMAASFKPDRASPPASAGALLATCAPLLLGCYWVLCLLMGLVFATSNIAAGKAGAGGMDVLDSPHEARASSPEELILRGLAHASDARAPLWREQVRLAQLDKRLRVERDIDAFPVHQLAVNLSWDTSIQDSERMQSWAFAHDAMLFRGTDMRSGGPGGTLGLDGVNGSTAFPELLSPLNNRLEGQTMVHFAAGAHGVFVFDQQHERLRKFITLRPDETLAGTPARYPQHIYALTNKRLIAYAPSLELAQPAQEQWSVALPYPLSNIKVVDCADVEDGVLVSFMSGAAWRDGATDNGQTLLFVAHDGSASVVARRQFTRGFPVLAAHMGWWLSPALHAVKALPDVLFDQGIVLDAGLTRYTNPLTMPRPRAAQVAALLCALLAALGAWIWVAPMKLSRPRKAGWLAACLLLGLPALATLLLFQTRPLARPLAAATPRAAAVA
ncbi:MAG: hypothetical protein V4582_02540 [Pseudomonadota bacterium]